MSSGRVAANRDPKVTLGASYCQYLDWRRVSEASIGPGRCLNLYTDTPYDHDHYLHLRTHACSAYEDRNLNGETNVYALPFSWKDNDDCTSFSFCHPSDNESEYRGLSVLLLMMVSHPAKNVLVTCYRCARHLPCLEFQLRNLRLILWKKIYF